MEAINQIGPELPVLNLYSVVVPFEGGQVTIDCRAESKEEARRRLQRYVIQTCRTYGIPCQLFKKYRFIDHQADIASRARLEELLAKHGAPEGSGLDGEAR